MYLAEDPNEGDGKNGKFNLKTISFVTLKVWSGHTCFQIVFNGSIAKVSLVLREAALGFSHVLMEHDGQKLLNLDESSAVLLLGYLWFYITL